MSHPATAFGRLKGLQFGLFLLYLAFVFRSFFLLVSFLPSECLKTLDLTQYYLLRYLRIFLITAVMLVTNSEVLDAFIALAVLLIAHGLGHLLLRLFMFGFDSLAEELVFGAGLGLVLLAGIAFLLGLFGLLYPVALYWTLAVSLLLGLAEIVHLGHRVWQCSWLAPFQKGDQSWGCHLLNLFLLGYLFVFLGIAFVACHLPEIEFDPLIYHLTVPKLYLQRHGIVDIPEILEAVFPKNISMLYLYGLALHSQITVKFLNFWMGSLLLLSLYVFARRLWNGQLGLIAAALVVSAPVAFFQLRSVYVDLPIALFCFLNLFALVRWMTDGGRRWLLLSAVFLGMAAGSKYNALFNVVAASVLVGHHFLAKRKRALLPALANVTLYGLVCLVSLLAWLFLTYRFTGDPLFPYLSGDPLFPFLRGLFHSERWETYNLPVVRSGAHRWGLPLTLANAFKTLWQMHFNESKFCGSLGPFFVMLTPLLIFVFKLHPVMKRLLVYFSVYLFFWLITTQANRYLVPALPVLSLLCAALLRAFLEAATRLQRSLRAAVVTGLVVVAFYNLPFLYYLWWVPGKRYFTPVLGAFPESVFSDNYNPERYLATYLGSLPAINFMNTLGNVKRVLYVGFRDGPPLFYANFPMIYNELNIYNRFVEERDLGRLLELIRENEISHLIVEQKYGVEKLVSSPESEFANRHLRLVWNKNAVSAFEVHQVPLSAKEYDITHYLIDHMAQGTILSRAGQPIYAANTYRDVHRLHPEARFCILTFDQFEVRIPVEIPVRAALRFGLGFKQNATRYPYVAQVFLQDPTGRQHPIFSRSLMLTQRFEDQRWTEEEVDLSRFAGQQVEVGFTCKAVGPVEHQAYPVAVPDAIVLWSEPQIIRRVHPHLDLLASFDRFKILPVAQTLETPNKSYAFVASAEEGKPDARKGLMVLSGGEARYDLVARDPAVLTFQLGWPECREPGTVAEILLETDGAVRALYQKELTACPPPRDPPTGRIETIDLKKFSALRATLVFRAVPRPGKKNGRQQVLFQNLRLE